MTDIPRGLIERVARGIGNAANVKEITGAEYTPLEVKQATAVIEAMLEMVTLEWKLCDEWWQADTGLGKYTISDAGGGIARICYNNVWIGVRVAWPEAKERALTHYRAMILKALIAETDNE